SFQRYSQRNRGAAHIPNRALLWVGAIVIAAGASTACVSTGMYTQLQHEKDTLAAQNEALKKQVEDANSDGEKLAQENSALASEKAALEQNLNQLQSQQGNLNSKLKENEEESAKMKDTYDGLLKSLKKELKAGQIEVTQMRDGLRVNVS